MTKVFKTFEELIKAYYELVKENCTELPPYAKFAVYSDRSSKIKNLVNKLDDNIDDNEKLKAITELWASRKNETVIAKEIPQFNKQLIHSITPRANTLGTSLSLDGKSLEEQKEGILNFASQLYKMVKDFEKKDIQSNDILNLNKAQREVLFWYYYNEDKYPIINRRAEESRKILEPIFHNTVNNDYDFNLQCLDSLNSIPGYSTIFIDDFKISKQLLLDQLFYSIDEIKNINSINSTYKNKDDDIYQFYLKLWNTIKHEKTNCIKEKSEKLNAYFDFFVKNNNIDDWTWYKSLKKWVDTLQQIKDEILPNEISNIDELNNYITIASENKLKNTDEFLNRYLFLQDNGTANIGQGFIYEKDRVLIREEVNNNYELLLNILINTDPIETSVLIGRLINKTKNYNAVRYRFLKTLFPKNFTSVEAENKFDRLINILHKKMNIQIGGKSYIEKHNCLMEQLENNNEPVYKKHIFYWELYYMLENDLDLKKAIVYYGAPGTGKTYRAGKEAKKFINAWALKTFKKEKEKKNLIEVVQFHPSYSYEDFIEGIRPSSGKSLELKSGIFKTFCKKAGAQEIKLYKETSFLKDFINREFSDIKIKEITNNEQKNILGITIETAKDLTLQDIIEPAFFIIDEINRAELSRVFGELMYSLEYRGYGGKIKTQYSYLNDDKNSNSVFFWEGDEDWFFIPQNVYLIGTMNTIDRSVDSFDFALRRRFMWEEMEPNYEVIKHEINKKLSDGKNIGIELAKSLKKLNKLISDDDLLGTDYQIGHSYALAIKNKEFEKIQEAKDFLWDEFIKPLIQEYLRGLGDNKTSNSKLNNFKKEFGVE